MLQVNGPVALLGSGEYTAAMVETDRLLLSALAAARPRVALIPAASGLEPGMPERWNRMGEQHFAGLGAVPLPLPLVSRDDAQNPAVLAELRSADLFYFSGGSPEHLVETMHATPAWELICAGLAAGGGIAGCSAGAMMMSAYTLRVRSVAAGQPPHWVSALNVVPGLVVMPHFDRMVSYVGYEVFQAIVATVPQSVQLVGIDEDTALIRLAAEQPWLVSGRQTVVLLDPDGTNRVYTAGEEVPLITRTEN